MLGLQRRRSRQPIRLAAGGFTIVELMVSTAVFGTVMLIIAVGALRFTHDYYKGVVSSRTQEAARAIMSELTQSLQFGTDVSATNNGGSTILNGYCMGSVEYSAAMGYQVTPTGSLGPHQAQHGLVKRIGVSGCGTGLPTDDVIAGPFDPTTQRELLGPHMRVAALDITQLNTDLYQIHLKIIYGDDDLLNPAVTAGTTDFSGEGCSGAAGSQWCAVSDLTTTVNKRIQ